MVSRSKYILRLIANFYFNDKKFELAKCLTKLILNLLKWIETAQLNI